ncbi:MAG: hypothetical protein ACE5KZ_04215 [Candidatus Scalinduaceae bacterium]
MSNNLNKIERRAGKRLRISLPIVLYDQKVKSENISSGGVYFEVTTSDTKKYSSGKAIAIEVVTSTSTTGLPEKTVRLTGTGVVIRTDEIEVINHDKRLGVALKFGEKLKLYV